VNILGRLLNFARCSADAFRVQVHLAVALYRFPHLTVQRPSVWRYDSIHALKIGTHVSIGPFTEVIVFSGTPKSKIRGRLELGNRVAIGAGCNLRAAGGSILIGDNTLLGQYINIIAANHLVKSGQVYRDLEWDETKTGVSIGTNCWVGAGCTILPGCVIGDNAVVGAGAIVTKSIPANEIWAGVPARFIKKIG
jgi:acetyltransferase-like isoleucine patch superfamily enzyme